jgi:hypothetical protein
MLAARRIPILVGIGLAMGLLIGLALVHFFWVAAVVILGFGAVEFVRRRR